MIEGSLIRPGLTSLQTKLIGVPTIRLSCDTTQIFHDHTHAQLISPSNQPNHCYSCHLLQVAAPQVIFMLKSVLWYDLVDCTCKHTNILLLLFQHLVYFTIAMRKCMASLRLCLRRPDLLKQMGDCMTQKKTCMHACCLCESMKGTESELPILLGTK